MAPFIWALYLALPCGVVATYCAAYVAAKVRRPSGARGRWVWPLRGAVFIAIAATGFALLLGGGVFLAMHLDL
jgi:hypothetical protein